MKPHNRWPVRKKKELIDINIGYTITDHQTNDKACSRTLRGRRDETCALFGWCLSIRTTLWTRLCLFGFCCPFMSSWFTHCFSRELISNLLIEVFLIIMRSQRSPRCSQAFYGFQKHTDQSHPLSFSLLATLKSPSGPSQSDMSKSKRRRPVRSATRTQ